ncbi:hypothetical protein PVLB_11145 [Pseudomonas sp. VLB120]|nr:hypothetical protein PVLB_11145 [Pseudomonas sp. VLB120]
MFAAANQTHFSLHIDGLEHDFQVLAFNGTEAISHAYAIDLELVSECPSLDLERLLHKPAFLQLDDSGRGLHGLIHRAAQGKLLACTGMRLAQSGQAALQQVQLPTLPTLSPPANPAKRPLGSEVLA